MFRTERSKTIPGPAAHPHIDHYKGVPSPPPPSRLQMHPFYSLSSMATGNQGFDLTACIRVSIWMVAITVFGYVLSRLTDRFHRKISYF